MLIFLYSYTIDVDECETLNGGCQQICNNTVGSYFCSCTEGYQLQMDGTTCQGQSQLDHIIEETLQHPPVSDQL